MDSAVTGEAPSKASIMAALNEYKMFSHEELTELVKKIVV